MAKKRKKKTSEISYGPPTESKPSTRAKIPKINWGWVLGIGALSYVGYLACQYYQDTLAIGSGNLSVGGLESSNPLVDPNDLSTIGPDTTVVISDPGTGINTTYSPEGNYSLDTKTAGAMPVDVPMLPSQTAAGQPS